MVNDKPHPEQPVRLPILDEEIKSMSKLNFFLLSPVKNNAKFYFRRKRLRLSSYDLSFPIVLKIFSSQIFGLHQTNIFLTLLDA